MMMRSDLMSSIKEIEARGERRQTNRIGHQHFHNYIRSPTLKKCTALKEKTGKTIGC